MICVSAACEKSKLYFFTIEDDDDALAAEKFRLSVFVILKLFLSFRFLKSEQNPAASEFFEFRFQIKVSFPSQSVFDSNEPSMPVFSEFLSLKKIVS